MNKNVFIALILLVAVLPLVLVLAQMQQNIQKKATGYEYTIQVDPNSSFARIMQLMDPSAVTVRMLGTTGVGTTGMGPTGVGRSGMEPTGVGTTRRPGGGGGGRDGLTPISDDGAGQLGFTGPNFIDPEPTIYDPDPRVREDL